MALSGAVTVLLFCLVLCTQTLGQRPRRGRRRNMERRLAALEAKCDYSKEEQRAARLVAKIEANIQTKLEVMQDGMQRLESLLQAVDLKVSAPDKLLQDNDLSLGSRNNGIEARLLARAENNTATLSASIARVEQMTKELATRMSAVEDKLDNATSLHAEETENIRSMLEDVKNTTKEMCGTLKHKRTCEDYYDDGQRTSGVYTLDLEDGRGPMEVYCDMRNGTGWVVFQRREDGSVDFYRDWKSYMDGFGDLYGEFWLGNRNIRRLTSAGLTQLRVDLQAWNGSRAFASYSNFSVGNLSSSYNLSVSGYSGTAGDSLARHSGHKFSTFDRDQDIDSGNCAQRRKGAWWYINCGNSNLNGQYGTRRSSGLQYVHWYHWLGVQSLQRTELKLK